MARTRDLGDKAYLLSPQDLAAYDLVDDAGRRRRVSASRSRAGSRARSTSPPRRRPIARRSTPRWRARSFALVAAGRAATWRRVFAAASRTGFLDGVNHQQLVHGRFPKSRGVRVGTVVGIDRHGRVGRTGGATDRSSVMKPGDGVVFDEGHPGAGRTGRPGVASRCHAVERAGSSRWTFESRRRSTCPPCPSAAIVWKTDDPALRKRLEHTFAADRRRSSRAAGGARYRAARRTTACSRSVRRMPVLPPSGPARWQAAQKSSADDRILREQFGRLGDTPFELGEVELHLAAGVMVPRAC